MSTLITLPDADTITAGLTGVDDTPHVVEHLYRRIAEHAGEELVPRGVALMLMRSVSVYTDGLPHVVRVNLYMNMRKFIAVLTGGDESATAEVAEVFAQCGPELR